MLPANNKLKKGDVVYIARPASPFYARVQIRQRKLDGRYFVVAHESYRTKDKSAVELETLGQARQFDNYGQETGQSSLYATLPEAARTGASLAQDYLASALVTLEQAQEQANLAAIVLSVPQAAEALKVP